MSKNNMRLQLESCIDEATKEQDMALINSFVAILLMDNDIPKECQKWFQTFWVTQT